MKTTRIKICGLCDPSAAQAATHAGAHAIGLVFVEKSARCVTIDLAKAIIHTLPALVEIVALFANASIQKISHITTALGIAAVQLHGQETPDFANELAQKTNLRIIKAIAFEPTSHAHTMSLWQQSVPSLSAILVDTPQTQDTALAGGSGRCFDWQKLGDQSQAAVPVILAGGLNPGNVAEAIDIVKPYAVDVSSGVESSPGKKDIPAIKQFIQVVQETSGK